MSHLNNGFWNLYYLLTLIRIKYYKNKLTSAQSGYLAREDNRDKSV